ncbi:hypothetical protein [Aquimarina algiphila]|uniref:hypothetical protein n=1 Tax=Aquimarina algiphila TaxID=2047982 RepID=UPI0023310B70|nr:hypothetical protein [Aquimarina algiphila]
MSQTFKNKETTNWALFDKKNKAHMNILSLLRQLEWTKPHDRYGEVADLKRLSNWLKSEKSPVNKPLMDLEKHEVSKIICALEAMTEKKHS